MTSPPSTLHATALKAVEGYNKWDLDMILAVRDPSCTHQTLPARLARPALDNAQYREYFSKVMPLFKSFHVEVLEVVEDAKNNKVVLHARSLGETVFGEYKNEYMFLLRMTEDHERLLSVKEFVDSGFTEDYFRKMQAHYGGS